MTMTRRKLVVLGGLSLYLMAMAFAAGVITDRLQFDQQRAALLKRYDEQMRNWHRVRILMERQVSSRLADPDRDHARP
jgi:hypothetical protein